MFNSGVKTKDLIQQIRDEADISYDISDEIYLSWLNALEQLMYTELIREQGKIIIDNFTGSVVDIGELPVANGENAVRFEEIYAVYADDTQLIKSTVASGTIFPDSYYKIGNNIGLNIKKDSCKLEIIYFVKPELKTIDTMDAKNVMLPIEFIDMAKAKIRGDAYKLANEDELSAKWLNDYNVLLETFKAWLSSKQAEFGI